MFSFFIKKVEEIEEIEYIDHNIRYYLDVINLEKIVYVN